MGRLHKPSRSRHRAPRDQNAGDPDARTDFVKDEVAGDLKQEVTPEENSRRKSELLAGIASSRFIVSAANPRLIRSMKGIT